MWQLFCKFVSVISGGPCVLGLDSYCLFIMAASWALT